MPSSSDEDESASIKYLKKNHDPSLRYWDSVALYKTERELNNACSRADNYYRGNKKMHIHKQRSKIYKLVKFKQYNLAHLNYLQSMKNPMFDYSTDKESNDFGKESSFSEDDEDMLMIKSLDYKLQARKEGICNYVKVTKKWKERLARSYWRQPDIEGEAGCSNHIVETYLSQ
jgi:hypothetical protein